MIKRLIENDIRANQLSSAATFPRKEGELAMSALNREDLGVCVGDEILFSGRETEAVHGPRDLHRLLGGLARGAAPCKRRRSA